MPGPSLNLRPYLPSDASTRLRRYVYRGVDRSLLYRFLWRPLCQWAVAAVPQGVAPNCITMFALIITVVTHAAMAVYLPDLEYDGNVPTWVYVTGGVGLLLYQFFDNLDGVQARRTKSSSPLGLIMDHGCDAINTTIGAISFAAAIQCGVTWRAWCCLCSLITVFLMATWEQYYRGEFVLPIINGANEGLMSSVVCYFISAAWGGSWWKESVVLPEFIIDAFRSVIGTLTVEEYLPRGVLHCLEKGSICRVQHNTLLVVALAITSLGTVLGNLWQVYLATRPGTVRHGFYRSTWLSVHAPYVHALSRLLPLGFVLAGMTVWAATSPAKIFSFHPRVMCWTLGLVFAASDVVLMVAHVCEVEFHAFRRTLVPYAFMGLYAGLSVAMYGEVRVDERAVLVALFLSTLGSFLHTAVNVVWETSVALDVRIFSLSRPTSEPHTKDNGK